MPMYEYKCLQCGVHQDVYCKIADKDKRHPQCCNDKMQQVIHVPYVQPDITPYRAAAIDKKTGVAPMITSRREHNDFLARNDYVCIGNDLESNTKRKPAAIETATREEIRAAIDHVAQQRGINLNEGVTYQT